MAGSSRQGALRLESLCRGAGPGRQPSSRSGCGRTCGFCSVLQRELSDLLFWYQGDSDDALIDTTYSSRTQKKFGTCCAANPSVYRKKRPAGGWDHGTCKATYVVERDGK